MGSPSPARKGRWVVPTRRFLWLVGALLLMGLLVSAWPDLEVLWVLLVLVLLLLFLLDVLLGARRSEVRVEREVPVAYLGREGKYLIRIHNEGNRPLRLLVSEVLPAACEGEPLEKRLLLLPQGQIQVERKFLGVRRGRYPLLPIGLRISTLLGLAAYQEYREDEASLALQPGRPSSETSWLLVRVGELIQDKDRSLLRRGGNWQFDSLREYCVGDEPRKIDWKASARRHRPMVRTYRSEMNSQVLFLLDTGRLMGNLVGGISKLDRAMTPLLDLSAVCLREGEKVGLMTFDAKPQLWVPPKEGLSHLHSLTQALTQLETSHEPTSYFRAFTQLRARIKKRSFLVIFSDFLDEISAEAMLPGLHKMAQKHMLLFVAVNDPQTGRILQAGAKDPQSLLEKAVAAQLLAERRRVLARIERMGIPTLDMDPQRLTGPLIRKYLQMRLGRV